jgi:hypothetical protein
VTPRKTRRRPSRTSKTAAEQVPAQRASAEGVEGGADTSNEGATEETGEVAPDEGNENDIDGFSLNASKAFFVFINRYLVDLERFSRFKAKQSGMETVNSTHVKEAASFLAAASASSDKSRKINRYCETFGGLMVGGGLSELCSLLATSNPPGDLISITIGLIGVGALLIGIFLGRE